LSALSVTIEPMYLTICKGIPVIRYRMNILVDNMAEIIIAVSVAEFTNDISLSIESRTRKL